MDKEIVGIFLGNHPYNRKFSWENLETGGIGGSEIWALKLGRDLSNLGKYTVILFCDTEVLDIPNPNFIIFPYSLLKYLQNIITFDFFITSRRVDELVYLNIKSKHNILMLHDVWTLDGSVLSNELLFKTRINAICYQSDYQKAKLQEHYPDLKDYMLKRVTESVTLSEYSDADLHNKKNKIVISSGRGRGDGYLCATVLDRIKEAVPDFEVDVCGYNDTKNAPYFEGKDYIHFLGNLTHSELVAHQKEAKMWIYPNHGYNDDGSENTETFCITATENAAAKNAIVCADWGCFSDTLSGYDYFIGSELVDDKNTPINKENLGKFADEIVERAIKILTDDDYRIKLVESAVKTCKGHDDFDAAVAFVKIFEELKSGKKY